ncbi:magnesium-transporting ATPase (P-type) [Yamadazyma tenuis]|uniref:Calcium ATPase n=1 Tax=Candida tenuis (strain ATCC 10573 / BCRC 21748 / CBS 615 / JCM 9827 / NBRC 10315 / NRRL Y-1498 / VKM Y-70) TaxID=590646 RepID=G3B0M7_CANTC|nr:calcium ATPase [Yamadazyma tenuis ATCC 10573]EGV65432.1 calcium ATPase [Yamadazyma tenuis ATCC 10573]WEJ94887.1 magnesium-transporting ATPase (P-type) [Yamadazyma tenuis]
MDASSIESKLESDSVSGFGFDRVKFNEEVERGRTRVRTGLLPIKSNVSSSSAAVPTLYKTISHSIDERLNDDDDDDKNLLDNQSVLELTWHRDTVEEVCVALGASLDTGLTDQQVTNKVKEYGRNVQTKPSSGAFLRISLYFFNGFGVLLLVAGILVIISYKPLGDPPAVANLVLGIILLVVFFLQAFLNFIQDYSSSQILNSINVMLPNEVKVLRNGDKTVINSEELVPGDVVFIDKNTKVPADLRLIESNNLQFDRCILTGETKPVKGKVDSDIVNYLENESIAMQGTLCINGTGKGVVLSTGDNTIFGKISKLSAKQREGLTTLQKELFRFILMISIVIVFVIVLVIVLWAAWLRHTYPGWINVPTLIVDVVSVMVSFIPEGLPIAMTVCLLVAAKGMRDHGILCKSLSVIETLGSVNVLCSDKTGTLTTGKMIVGAHYGDLERLKMVGKLCNECIAEDGQVTTGNQTDQSIMNFSEDSFVDSRNYTLVDELGFNSKNKYMIKVFECGEGILFTIKGAPEVLIEKASFVLVDGERTPLTDDLRQKLIQVQFDWCNQGERVVLLGSNLYSPEEYQKLKSEVPDNDELDVKYFPFSVDGMMGISDPLRQDIPETVVALKAAHIKIVMITGDFEITAKAIATKCGIVSHNDYVDNIDSIGVNSDCVLINGYEMFRLSEIEWDHMMNYKSVVFSRTTPEQKLKIVKEFQKRKNVVGMIGDGVNDSPSIKQADIGISMIDGSEIAQDASDLVLMDSFVSIIHGVKFSRLVFENLRKTICYLLPAGSYAELWAVLLNVIFGFPQMLSSFFMIIISCITDCVAAMTISFEAEESNLLTKMPRQMSGERLVDYKLFLHSYLTLGTYYSFTSMLLAFLNFTRHGFKFSELHKYAITDEMNEVLSRSSSIYFVNLVILQFFNLLTVRTRFVSCLKNFSWKLLVILPIFASTFIWNYIPQVQKALDSSSVPVEYYFISFGFGSLLLVYDELRKLMVRKYPNGLLAKIAW